ncbi:MAG TPA: hypothetical protein PK735_03250, partial [Flavobacteriales bacterium]|nr:hypothetical protein [Flavobacteriales bacterium]
IAKWPRAIYYWCNVKCVHRNTRIVARQAVEKYTYFQKTYNASGGRAAQAKVPRARPLLIRKRLGPGSRGKRNS